MCGIYGSTKLYSKDIISKKLEIISFRGPDNSSYNLVEGVILGHNRLSIVDLDPRSHQPFLYEYIRLTFNGEIYNFKSLKEGLESKGYKFRTESDTEVVCALYIEYGENFVKKLNGMFAFVLHDMKNSILFGAVDRLGQKPLYYTIHRTKELEFSSQIKQILVDNKYSISDQSSDLYFYYGHIPAPHTIYRNIFKLEPGFCFTYNLTHKNLNTSKYWDIDENKDKTYGSYEDEIERCESLLEDATRIRMLSDVPIGTFLSGGVDSSLVTALAQKNSSVPLKTFSIKFDQDKYDESEFAAKVAKHLSTDHMTIFCDVQEGLALINKLPEFFDEPFADSSAIPTMLISKHTRKFVTVALTGDAGDESFLGYKRYDWISKLAKLYSLPSSFRKQIADAISLSNNYRFKIIADKLRQNNTIEEMIHSFQGTMFPETLLSKENLINNFNSYLQASNNPVQKSANLDLKLYLPSDILVKVDRASMAYSLECRSSFLDYRVVEYAKSLPIEYRYKKNNKKRILKDILYKHIPRELIDRPKQGFAIPLEKWLKNELRELVNDSLTDNKLKEIPNLNIKYIRSQMQLNEQGKINFSPNIWSLLMYTLWKEHYDQYSL